MALRLDATAARAGMRSAPRQLDAAAFAELRRRFESELIRPDDAGYDVHRRVWNGSVDRHPALIARCTGAGDVVAAIAFGRETGLPIAVRGGGHSFPGLSVCDGGVVVDVRPMHRIDLIRPDGRCVRGREPCWASWTVRRSGSGWRCRAGR